MREALLILTVIAVLILLTAVRYRRQLRAMFEFWRVVKRMRLQPGRSEVADTNQRAAGPLVKCAGCGAWVPEERAVQLGRTAYCSPACIESTAAVREQRS